MTHSSLTNITWLGASKIVIRQNSTKQKATSRKSRGLDFSYTANIVLSPKQYLEHR